uniref:C2H2-type domain-containing protein n=1 Tax=Meloidogyne javanica TaxID=6303 RepID=A0A915M182_MELJA
MSSSSPNSSSPPLSSFNLQYENNLNIITSINSSPNIPTTKAFICEICNKAFRFRSNLAEHRSVHTAVKPFAIEFLERSMIVLNNSSSANNAKQRNSKESDSKESSVNLDNNDINNEINTDNLFNSLGFNNSFEMKEEENNDQQALASSPLTPENENTANK